MGNFTLIIVTGLLIMFSVTVYNVNKVQIDTVENSVDYYNDTAARYLAKSSLNYTLYSLKQDPTLTGTIIGSNKFFSGGVDTVVITDVDTSHVNIDVTAWVGSQKHEISALVEVSNGGSGFGWAIFVGHDIHFGGDGVINGNIYAEHSIHNGGGWVVNGDEVEPPPVLAQPTVDWSVYRNDAIAAGSYYTSGLTFTAAGSPYSGIYYTTGTATVKAGAVINGSIISEGSVKLDGDNSVITTASPSYPVIIANDVASNGDGCSITGFIYVGHDFRPGGDDLTVVGTILAGPGHDVAGGGANKSITYDATYATTVTGITFDGGGGGGGGATTVQIVSVYE